MSRGETVLVGYALLEATTSRGWSSPHLQSLPLKDRVVVGKLDMIAWVVSSTRHGASSHTRQGRANLLL